MPTDRPAYAPHKARLYTRANGVDTAGDWYAGHLIISSTSAAVETGVINENELGKFIFGTAHRDDFTIGKKILVNGEFYTIVGPVEVLNSVAILQRCEVAVQRVKT